MYEDPLSKKGGESMTQPYSNEDFTKRSEPEDLNKKSNTSAQLQESSEKFVYKPSEFSITVDDLIQTPRSRERTLVTKGPKEKIDAETSDFFEEEFLSDPLFLHIKELGHIEELFEPGPYFNNYSKDILYSTPQATNLLGEGTPMNFVNSYMGMRNFVFYLSERRNDKGHHRLDWRDVFKLKMIKLLASKGYKPLQLYKLLETSIEASDKKVSKTDSYLNQSVERLVKEHLNSIKEDTMVKGQESLDLNPKDASQKQYATNVSPPHDSAVKVEQLTKDLNKIKAHLIELEALQLELDDSSTPFISLQAQELVEIGSLFFRNLFAFHCLKERKCASLDREKRKIQKIRASI